ncbi:amidohydrolase [Clostridium hydrogenum]|uniref:amidohydrolase n=1 Tax=Clostridium hydrogenum TaxID=2855764 RepID=UPI001F1FEE08|nr:amidohydrolase [Clostridium hydrogenum]
MDNEKLTQNSICADIILYNGKIVTVDKEFSIAQAVAIKGNTILAVGKNEDMNSFKAHKTQIIDLEGKTVIPGLIDSHIHASLCAKEIKNFILSEVKTIAELLKEVEKCVKASEPGKWIISSSAWHESQLVENRFPTRWELDRVAPNNPVMISRGGHVLVVNSKALELGNITKDTIEPEGGIIVRNHDTKEPTGVLLENAAAVIRTLIPKPTEVEVKQNTINFMKEMNSYGITGMTDAWAKDSDIEIYSKLNEEKKLTVRTQALYPVMNLEETLHAVSKYKPLEGDDYFRIGGIKTMVDGGVEAAWMKEPYEIVAGMQLNPEYRGIQIYDGEARKKEFKDILKLVAEKGFQIQTHVAGDAAIEFVVNSYEEINEITSIKDLRWTAMYVMYPTKESLDKIKKLDIFTTVQNHPYLLGKNMKSFWGERRANSAIPIRTIMDKEIVVGGGTDAPIVPWNPFISISWMVTRRIANGEVQGIDESISRERALYIWTMGSAYTQGSENKLGSIEKGKSADLVVISKDLLTIPVEEIQSIKAIKTIVGGKLVYQRNN